jgi:glutaredoxin
MKLSCFFFIFTLLFSVNITSAGVIVFDSITPSGKAVKLKALTKGRFFAAGGKLVTFYVDGEHIGTTLSGGDGYAFLKYLPSSSGIRKLKAESGDETDEGVILVTGKNDNVILVEIESTLFVPSIRNSFKPSKESKDALNKISKKFRIIYLTNLMGATNSRKWLKDNGFPPSPVLRLEGPETLDDLNNKGIRLYGIIGSPALIAEASDIEKKYSFEETEVGTEVKDWEDLSKQLLLP